MFSITRQYFMRFFTIVNHETVNLLLLVNLKSLSLFYIKWISRTLRNYTLTVRVSNWLAFSVYYNI